MAKLARACASIGGFSDDVGSLSTRMQKLIRDILSEPVGACRQNLDLWRSASAIISPFAEVFVVSVMSGQ